MESRQIAQQCLADLVFYISLNFVGFYLRYVNEINMRRGFLDKRSCIETTFKLKYEKEQEVISKVLYDGREVGRETQIRQHCSDSLHTLDV